MDEPMQTQSSVHWYFLRHCRMSSSSFRWRLCSWERHWLKSSASCRHLSLVIDWTGADIQTNHNSHITSHVSTTLPATNSDKLEIHQSRHVDSWSCLQPSLVSPPPRLEQCVLHCTGRAHRQPNAPDGLVLLSPPRLFRCLPTIPTSS